MRYKEISGYEWYCITDDGRVWTDKYSRYLTISEKHGYEFVSLFRNGRTKHFAVHRLVAEAFIGIIPHGMQINHIDGNKRNNHVSNLEIVTPKENINHSWRTGLRCISKISGENSGGAKLNKEQVASIREKILKGIDLGIIADEFGVTVSNIRLIKRGKTWKN